MTNQIKIKYLIYLFSAFIFAYSINVSMIDDGLRHLSFAYNRDLMKSWGDIFPHSLFTSYDPWFMWHNLLSILIDIFAYSNVHIVVNTLSLFFLLVLIHKHFENESKYDYESVTYIIVFSILYLSYFRYVLVRPDLLSGLYILYMLTLKNKFYLTLFVTIIYGPFYYLFFVYTGIIGLTYMIQKDWKSFLGTFLGSSIVLLIYLYIDKVEYLNTILNILNDQSLRMGLEVSEGAPLFNIFKNINYYILLPIFLLSCTMIIYLKYDYFSKNKVATFLLISSLLWTNQVRYYILFLPLILIFVVTVFLNLNKKILFYRIRKILYLVKKYIAYSKKAFIFYIIAIPYSIFIFSYAFSLDSRDKELDSAKFFKNEEYNNKIILFNSLDIDIYKALYFNPTIKTIPSCSVGWFEDNKEMKDIYIRMQKDDGVSEKELKKLIDFVGADIYIHRLRNDKQVLNFKKLENLGITPVNIYKNRIIFNIKRKINE
ncbi:hypothetical protein ACMC56_02100 [Campylobacterota bacterium DY0563]